METTAVRLIRVDDEGLNYSTFADCRVDYSPSKKYRVEKANAFDPTYIHRRFPYFEDKVDVTFILEPVAAYAGLLAFVTAPGALYIEFTWKVSITKQLPVICVELPALSDELREFTAEARASFISRYETVPGLIDWASYSVPDGLEEIYP